MNNHQPAITGLSSGVDYIACTAKQPEIMAAQWHDARMLLDDEEDNGNKRREYTRHGMRCVACGEIDYGIKGDEYSHVRLRGSLAAAQWRRMWKSSEQVTRFDVQTTVTFAYNWPELGDEMYELVKQRGEELTAKRNYSIISNVHGGTTLYVGKRTSAFFGRVYDKSAQQGRPPGAEWRYEVECKSGTAQSIAQQLAEMKEDEYKHIAEMVYEWFARRGVIPVYNAKTSVITMEQNRVPSDDAKKLRWLQKQVGPAVRDLIDRGRIASVEEVLGIRIQGLMYNQLSLIEKEVYKND